MLIYKMFRQLALFFICNIYLNTTDHYFEYHGSLARLRGVRLLGLDKLRRWLPFLQVSSYLFTPKAVEAFVSDFLSLAVG